MLFSTRCHDIWCSWPARSAMRYVSTRGNSAPQTFADILLAGLAPDGGLFLPEAWPQFSAAEISAFAGKPYGDVAFAVLKRLAGDCFSDAELKADIAAAYATFEVPEIAPLVEIGKDQFLMEL